MLHRKGGMRPGATFREADFTGFGNELVTDYQASTGTGVAENPTQMRMGSSRLLMWKVGRNAAVPCSLLIRAGNPQRRGILKQSLRRKKYPGRSAEGPRYT